MGEAGIGHAAARGRAVATAAGILALAGLAAGCSPPGATTAKAPAPEPAVVAEAAAPQPAPKYREIETPGAGRDAKAAYRTDTVDVIVGPKGSPDGADKLEYKISMKAGDTLTYAWEAEGADDLWHEFHGHTADTVAFYRKAGGAAHQGVLVAPFDGIHGWYFENRSGEQVVVRLRMGGFYELVRD